MVHLRVNNRESNPNPHINFITALPAATEDEQEDARQFLRALAAQVRPVMKVRESKSHGIVINSLEEYEFNAVFAGRNWNNGETIELVLRSPSGSFQSTSWIMSTFCHELAHVKHMNHGPAFQALWSQLRTEVRQLQDKGYYGDGYWSSGKRLADSATVSGQGIESGVFPEFMCGGAHSRARPTARRRRRPRDIVPSNSSGRQTAKKRKAGSRVTSKYAFTGEGNALGEGGSGGGYRKQAASKRAREARALAAEKRTRMPQQGTTGSDSDVKNLADSEDASENGSDDEVLVSETDADRRHTLVESERGDLQGVKTGISWLEFEKDFVFTGKGKAGVIDPELSTAADDGTCDMPVASGSTFTIGSSALEKKEKLKSIGLGNLVQNEIDLRKKEALGMAPGSGHKLRGNPSMSIPSSVGWICRVCTLENEPKHLACSACAMPKGAKVWSQEG